MDLGLKELGITFLVGAFTILGLEMILYHFCSIKLTGFFHGRLGLSDSPEKTRTPESKNGDESDRELTMRTAVFIGLAFAIGVLAEDVSEKYRDGLHIPFNSVSGRVFPAGLIDRIDLPVKYDARMKTLFKDSPPAPRP